MTHVLEVSQIARTIAAALCLNEALTEAIALGHDLGHTPFGQGKDPFSLKTPYIPDPVLDKNHIAELYSLSRAKYARPLEEAKKVIKEEQKDVIEKLENFMEPII